MLSRENLAANAHPTIRFEARSIRKTAENQFLLSGPLTIRGQTRTESLPVRLERPDGVYRFSGSFKVRQTDYGIQPADVAGVVKVRNEVEIRYRMQGRPAGSCR